MNCDAIEYCEENILTREQILEGIEIIRDYPYDEDDEEYWKRIYIQKALRSNAKPFFENNDIK